MRTSRIMALALCLPVTMVAFMAATASAETIISTVAGGPWAEPATWVGGVVPGADDDVAIAGPVTVAGTESCQSLSVAALGYLGGAFAGPQNTLQVAGAVDNAGTIDDGAFNFFLTVAGDLHNSGTWANHQTTITGTADRQLSHAPAAGFATDIVFGPGAAGDLVAANPLAVTGNVNVTGGRLVLPEDCPFTLASGAFSGELAAGGNEMHFVSWSYLTYCSLDDVVLVGEVEASISVTFTTRVTVADTLQNLSGNGAVTIYGDLINEGLIRNNQYGFAVFLYGDLVNNGAITCSQLLFEGEAIHHIAMDDEAVISANVFLPEFQPRTLIADTPVRFANGLGLGVGTLILEPGSSLRFTAFGGVGSGTILANGNTLSVDGSGAIGGVTVDQGVIGDQVALQGASVFTGGLTVTGTLTSWTWSAADVSVAGLLRNEGVIQDGDQPVVVTALGNVENLATFASARVVVAGTVDQTVAAGPGIAVPEFVLASGLQADSYQWYRDGAPLPGETAPELTLVTVGAADYGSYHCAGGDEISRTIVVAESLATTDVPGVAAPVVLEQNRPNPFNPATDIAFSLDRSGPVRLVIYDLAGRQVATLVDGERAAGRHTVSWQPRGLPSGTYVYRLQTSLGVLTRKCALLK